MSACLRLAQLRLQPDEQVLVLRLTLVEHGVKGGASEPTSSIVVSLKSIRGRKSMPSRACHLKLGI